MGSRPNASCRCSSDTPRATTSSRSATPTGTPLPEYTATIHHGIDTGRFPLGQAPTDSLLFSDRIHADKGVEEAIEVAARAGMPLTIAGIVQDAPYFEERVRPHIDGKRVTYVGSVGPSERGELLGGVTAMLHLINFEEPFGFSVVESMACGTPVIARRRGSMPEIVRHRENGALVDTLDEAVGAIDDVRGLDRAAGTCLGRIPVRRVPHGRRVPRALPRIVDPNRTLSPLRRAS